MFEDIFENFYDKNKEIRLIGVWGKDGLELEKQSFSVNSDLDMELTGAEMADIISKLECIKLSPDKYYIKLNFKGAFLLVFSLTQDFFLMIVAEKTVIPAKLNFYLNLYKDNLTAHL